MNDQNPTQPVADPNAVMPGAPVVPAQPTDGTPAPVEPTPTVPSETPAEPGMPTETPAPAAEEMPGVTPPATPTGEQTTGTV